MEFLGAEYSCGSFTEEDWQNAEAAHDRWKAIDLPKKRAQWVERVRISKQNREQLIESKKEMVTRVKTFREAAAARAEKPPETREEEFRDLIKFFQTKIDEILGMNREVNKDLSSIVGVFEKSYKEAQDEDDPANYLGNFLECKGQLMAGEGKREEVKALKAKLGQYEREMSEMQNQEVTIETLKNTVQQYKSTMEDNIDDVVQSRMHAVSDRNDTLLAQLEDEEESLKRKIEEAQSIIASKDREIESLRKEVSALLDEETEIEIGKTAELDLVMAESKKLSDQLGLLQAQYDSLEASQVRSLSDAEIQASFPVVDSAILTDRVEVANAETETEDPPEPSQPLGADLPRPNSKEQVHRPGSGSGRVRIGSSPVTSFPTSGRRDANQPNSPIKGEAPDDSVVIGGKNFQILPRSKGGLQLYQASERIATALGQQEKFRELHKRYGFRMNLKVAVLIYSVFLHLLVALTLIRLSRVHTQRRVELKQWRESTAAHKRQAATSGVELGAAKVIQQGPTGASRGTNATALQRPGTTTREEPGSNRKTEWRGSAAKAQVGAAGQTAPVLPLVAFVVALVLMAVP